MKAGRKRDARIMEVTREGGVTYVSCSACFVGCESVGRTTVEALMRLPCSHYVIDETADAEESRTMRAS